MQKFNFILALALLSACGDGNGASSVPIDQVDEKLAESFCGKIFQCCDEAERAALGTVFGGSIATEAECVMRIQTGFAEDSAEQQAAVTAGRLEYHGDKAGECFKDIDEASCTGLLGDDLLEGGACDEVFVGKVAAGQACASDEECAGGNFCKDASNDEVNGTCTATPTAGQPCPDFTCTEGNFCSDGMCAAVQANGQPCMGDDECQSEFCDDSGAESVCGTPPANMTCDGA